MAGSLNFDRCRAFTRGYLLACDWAGARPRPDAEDRIPRLAGEEVIDLYDRFRQLPRATREALRASWPKREPRCRLDEADVHPSWVISHLDGESAATLLVALGEIKPELGREVLRSLWPRVKPAHEEELQIRPLPPAWSGELRRWLFRRFIHATTSVARQDPLNRLTALDAQQVWLLAQDLGREELATVAAARPEEIGALLQRLPSVQASELARWLGLESGVRGSEPTDTMPLSARPKAADPKELDSECFRTASDHVRVVLELSEGEGNFLGSIGLRSLAGVLATHPREHALQIAQRIGLPLAQRLLAWRDEIHAGGGSSTRRHDEILRTVGAMPVSFDVPTSNPRDSLRDPDDGSEATSASTRREAR